MVAIAIYVLMVQTIIQLKKFRASVADQSTSLAARKYYWCSERWLAAVHRGG